jgi:hypothetical protein
MRIFAASAQKNAPGAGPFQSANKKAGLPKTLPFFLMPLPLYARFFFSRFCRKAKTPVTKKGNYAFCPKRFNCVGFSAKVEKISPFTR